MVEERKKLTLAEREEILQKRREEICEKLKAAVFRRLEAKTIEDRTLIESGDLEGLIEILLRL